MDYSQFEVFNAAEETINFGARFLEEDNLYETCTLSTLSVPTEEDESVSMGYSPELTISSCIKNGQLILAVNSRISVFSNLICSVLLYTQKFDAIIDCFQVTDNGQTILLCLRNGSIVVIDIEFGKYESREIVENRDEVASFFIGAFLETSTIQTLTFLVVNKSGILYRLLIKRCQNDESSMEIISEELKNLNCDIKTAAYSNKSKTLLMNGKELVSYNIEKNIELRTDAVSIKSCHIYNNYKFLILMENGKLCLISNNLYIYHILPDRTFKEIQYFHTNKDGNFMTNLSNKKESGKSVYELVQFPDYTSYFELNMSGDVYLICPNNINDEYLYICNDGSGCLRICNVYETNPMQRLQRLLRKGKFNEADVIAEKFDLNKTEIYKARINQMVYEDNLDESNVTILLDYLDKVGDITLKLMVCLSASGICEEFSDVQRILEYGCNLEIPKQLRNSDVLYQQDAVTEKMYLFEIYMELRKLTNCESYDMQGWIHFNQINLIAEVQRQLNNHNFEVAILLYNRFVKKEFEQLTDRDIKKMLHSISSVPLTHSRPFLCTFIPTTLRHQPTALSLIVSWARQCTLALETAQHNARAQQQQLPFPESAIELIKAILSLLDDTSSSSTSSLYGLRYAVTEKEIVDDCVDMPDSPFKLRLLLEMLESIGVLRDEFDVNLPLAVYMENNQSLIHSFLMIPMEVEGYKIFLKKFVIPYILKNNMDPDQVFLNEMKGLLAYEEKHWISIIPTILGVFRSVTMKLDTVLLILCGVNPPWNDTIHVLAEKALKAAPTDHPLVAQINECIRDEPIQIVLNRQDYRIPKSADIADALTFTTIVERIIYCMFENKSPSLEVDIYTLCTTNEKRDEANLILAVNYINHGDVEKALTYVDAISTEEKVRSCQSLLSTAMNKIGAGWFTDSVKPFWLESFQPLMNRLEELMEPLLFNLRTSRYQKLRTLSLIRTHFPEWQITLTDISRPKSIENERVLTSFLTEKYLASAESPEKLMELIKISLKIASTVLIPDRFNNKTEIDLLLAICEESDCLPVIVAIADFVSDYEVITPSSETLSLMAVLLMRNIGMKQQHCLDTTMLAPHMLSDSMLNVSFCAMEKGSVGADVGANLRALQLAIRLAELSLTLRVGNGTSSASCDEVFAWATCMIDLVRSVDQGRTGYRGALPNMNTCNTIRQLTELYCGVVGNFNNPNMKLLSYYTKDLEIYASDNPQLLRNLQRHIKHLCVNRHHFTALYVVSAFKNCLSDVSKSNATEFREVLNHLSNQVSERVLKRVLTEEPTDTNMAFILMAKYDYVNVSKTIGEYFRVYRKNNQKLSQIADLGLRLAALYTNQTSLHTTCALMKLRSKWILTLQPTNISSHEFYTAKADHLLMSLISTGCFSNLKMMEAFCTDFGLPVSDYFEVYIQRTLLSWKPERRGGNVVSGAKTEELYDRCMEVAKVYKGDLFHIINNLWGSINCYYYEVFLAIIRILETLSPDCLREKVNQKTLLHFLQEYRRVSKPGESELEEFFKRFPNSHAAEPLSEWRLPFLTNTFFSTNIMKILKPEINLSTYKRWFDAIPALEGFLTKDYVCCYVIRSVVSSGALQVDKSHDWMLFSVRSNLFDEINDCVTYIDNLEMATSALYHLTIHTPPGADQVKAAELCYTYAKKLRESAQETVDNANKFEKVKAKYYGSRVNQILHTYQLATEACLQLISDPHALIKTIYMDPRILQTYDSSISSCPDINEAVAEIAKLYEMDIVEKQQSLVEAWLFDDSISSANDTIKVIFNADITSDGPENYNDNFKRACYIFSSENISYWQDYLVEIGMNEESNDKIVSHLTKARALRCFYTISSIAKVESLVGTSYEELKNYIDKLFLLSDMERLGYSFSIETLGQMNKIRLLQDLTRHLDKNTTRIMASICTTYIISDLKCWEFIINNFVKFEQFNDLKEAVIYLKDVLSFKYKKFYINAWQCVLNNEISRLRYDTQAPVDPHFVGFVLMIQTCPVASRLNLSSILDKFVQLGWWEFVAIFIEFSNDENDLILQIKSHCPNIMNKLIEYSNQGVLVLKIKRMLK